MMFSAFLVTLQEARSLHVHKNVDSKSLLHKLGINPSNHKQHIGLDGDDLPVPPGDRISPGGPDPRHNGRSPPRN